MKNDSPPRPRLRGRVRRAPGLMALAVGALVALSTGRATAEQITTDLWDVSQGSVVTAHSGTLVNFPITGMFGGLGPAGNPNTLFRDFLPAGTVHFVEWRTPTPVLLEGFNLFATHDAPPFDANERGFSRFTLFARDPVTLDFEPIFEFFPTNPYTIIGDQGLLVRAAVAPVEAQEFRAEFVQFGDRTPTASGPRVLELDGFGTPVPEPAAVVLFGAGALGLLGYTWRWRARAAS